MKKLLPILMFLLLGAAQAVAAVSAGPITNPANGHRYYALSPNSWTGAEAEAQSLGGHLVTINDAAENSWVWETFSQFVKAPFWIGLNDADQEGTFVWASGQSATYLNWWCRSSEDCEPTNMDGVEHYVEMNNYVWNDNDNGKLFYAVAEVETSLPGNVITPGTPITVTPTPIVVNNGPGNQTDPHVDGNLVAYTSAAEGVTQIRYFDFATNVDSGIPTTGTSLDFLSDVSGNIIAFSRVDYGVQSIWTFDTTTEGPSVQLAPGPGLNRRGGVVGGPTVGWQDLGFSSGGIDQSEIVAYDMPTGTVTRLTNDSALDRSPAVSPDGNVVVWEKCASNIANCDIWQAVKESSGWTVSQVTATPDDERFPDSNGTLVVYGGSRAGNLTGADIYWKPVTGGMESQLAMDGQERNPNISENVIVFESRNLADPTPHWDIYFYNLSTLTLYRLTNTPSLDEILNDVSVVGSQVRVVWSVRESDHNVYATTFSFPAANAGPDQTVHNGSVVTLDGSASSDPDLNYPLTYTWTIASTPVGSTATLSDPAVVNPSFTADLPGDYTLKLVVKDSSGFISVADTVTLSTSNTPPVADAGPDQAITFTGETVQLDGSGSYDLEGDQLTYQWTLVQKPLGSTAALSDPALANPTFIADAHGDYVVTLVVSDPWSTSAADTVTMSFTNSKPVADAGGNQSVVSGSLVTLDGGKSTDANRDALTYAWSFVSTPPGSSALLASSLSSSANFTPDEAGAYVVSLVVNDGFVDSDPSNATIVATSGTHSIIRILTEAISAINQLGAGNLKNGNMANTLTNKINATIQMIDQGLYQDAIDQLQNDILAKTDGCAIAGGPDKNDWITSCTAQNQVYPLLIEAINLLRLVTTPSNS